MGLYQDIDNLIASAADHAVARSTVFGQRTTASLGSLFDSGGGSTYGGGAVNRPSLQGLAGGDKYKGGGGTLGYIRSLLGMEKPGGPGGGPVAIWEMMTGLSTDSTALEFGGGVRNFDADNGNWNPNEPDDGLQLQCDYCVTGDGSGSASNTSSTTPVNPDALGGSAPPTPSDRQTLGQFGEAVGGAENGISTSFGMIKISLVNSLSPPAYDGYIHMLLRPHHGGGKGGNEPGPDDSGDGIGYPLIQAMVFWNAMHGGDFGDSGQGGGVVFIWSQGRSWEPGDGSMSPSFSSGVAATYAAHFAAIHGGDPF